MPEYIRKERKLEGCEQVAFPSVADEGKRGGWRGVAVVSLTTCAHVDAW